MRSSFQLAAALMIGLTALSYGQYSVIYTFPNPSAGNGLFAAPYIGSGGVLYGSTNGGGSCSNPTQPLGCGTVFSLAPPALAGGPWINTLLYSFNGPPDGLDPLAPVLPGPGGSLFGTTSFGGPTTAFCKLGCGTFYQLFPPAKVGGTWTEQILLDFPGADTQVTGLVAGNNGTFFGASTYGGRDAAGRQECPSGCGSVYELQPPAQNGSPWTRKTIHQFSKGVGGFYPNSPLLAGSNGTLYGTTFDGGAVGSPCFGECGVVFALTPPQAPATQWGFAVLHHFQAGSDGSMPDAGLVIDTHGVLYGTTSSGGGAGCGGNGCGTVFSLTSPSQSGDSWTEAILYTFQGGQDGMNPGGHGVGLVIGPGGVLYGASAGGSTACGVFGCGVLFQLSPPAQPGGPWVESVLHSFAGGADGFSPLTAPAIDSKGVLYGVAAGGVGTACQGGGCGIVYQYIP